MYDMQADPGEKSNLFDDSTHAEMKGALLAAIHTRPDDAKGHNVQVGMA